MKSFSSEVTYRTSDEILQSDEISIAEYLELLISDEILLLLRIRSDPISTSVIESFSSYIKNPITEYLELLTEVQIPSQLLL